MTILFCKLYSYINFNLKFNFSNKIVHKKVGLEYLFNTNTVNQNSVIWWERFFPHIMQMRVSRPPANDLQKAKNIFFNAWFSMI